ncbi:trace amine-associated receptor 13c-like [Channa argus]|uniref:trace amine-associated receptor 13c-like n=1 Tax=Channa argus TaxID=215402 RepID=UPI00352174CD
MLKGLGAKDREQVLLPEKPVWLHLLLSLMEEVELCFPQLNTSCWKPKRPLSVSVLIYIVLSFISLLTVTLNLLVIISISHFKQLHTPTNLLLLSLAVSDFFVGLLWLFQIILIDGCWLFGDFMCALYYGIDYIITSTSVGTMVLISIDRYVAICDPLHYSTNVGPKRVAICVSLCWVCSLFFLGVLMNSSVTQSGRYNSCVGECVIVIQFIYQIIGLILTFVVPIAVIIVLYMRVFAAVLYQARAMRSHTTAVSLTAKKSELKAARSLGLVIVVFLLCICPYFCVTLTGQDTLLSASSIAFAICLFYFNSCLNPMIYALLYPWFRKSIRLIITLQILRPGSCETNML